VAEIESSDGFPIGTGGSIQQTYEITPLLINNRDKKGLALDGQIKHEDTCLASSTLLPPDVEETKEVRENLGIVVHYSVKVRCIVAFGSDLTMELPFTLTHPEPKEKVVSQMVTLPLRASLSSATGDNSNFLSAEIKSDANEDTVSVHDVIDQNLITFDSYIYI
jgi:beta-arrestin